MTDTTTQAVTDGYCFGCDRAVAHCLCHIAGLGEGDEPRDPDSHVIIAQLTAERDALAAQLAAAEARAREASLDALAAYGQAADAHAAQLAAEAKLATARGEALEEAARYHDKCEADEIAVSAKYRGGSNPWFAHVQSAKWHANDAAAIRALAKGES